MITRVMSRQAFKLAAPNLICQSKQVIHEAEINKL